jgi:3-methyl-2-oxobutanoate hydroxymethyltransferase
MSKKKSQLYMRDLQAMKERGEKIVLAAPWDYNSTQMAEEAGADMVVIGGATVAMMLGGQPHALNSSMEDVLCLTQQCAPAIKRAVFYVSMPYGSFHVSPEQTVENAIRLVKAGAHCIKAQTPGPLKRHAQAIIDAGIPFIGHVGLLPQLIYKRGGFRVFGRTSAEASELYQECAELEAMGASAIEMEAVPHRVATEITKRLKIPVFGIGAGPHTDGQFQVLTDVFGLQKDFSTSFSKQYINIWPLCAEALSRAFEEVRSGTFPENKHSFEMADGEWEKFSETLEEATE